VTGINTIALAGCLAGDPELRATVDGKSVVNFIVAETPGYYKAGERKDGETRLIGKSCNGNGQKLADIKAGDVGASLRRAPAAITSVEGVTSGC